MKTLQEIKNYINLEEYLNLLNSADIMEKILTDFHEDELFSEYCKKSCPKFLQKYLYKVLESNKQKILFCGAVKYNRINELFAIIGIDLQTKKIYHEWLTDFNSKLKNNFFKISNNKI